ncbi:hypothetical protein ACRALDRAFT_2044463 [Sodiomyces alcalophilus JCM 7366]|uniref:uncharacterized protein n=1 Tax=Sodiomyces alcalophilus JCM 7366 TaxID=591952 RepID=UPI0039B5552C
MAADVAPSTLQPPPLSEPAFWDDTQWAVLWSLMEALLPSICRESDVSDENSQVTLPDAQYADAIRLARARMDADAPPEDRFKDYLEFCPVHDDRFRADVISTLSMTSTTARDAMGKALSKLGTRIGSLLLTGYLTPVHHQPIDIREAILKAWTTSRLTSLRVLGKSLAAVAQKASLVTNPLLRDLIGYTDLPEHHRPADGFDFRFEQLPAADGPASIETDIVIVGSGCGGAVCAKSLAEAGHRVLVVDKGYHFAPSQLPMPQSAGCHYLYENGGFLTSDDASLNLVAGACWGGGGTVNWSVALQTQGFVREEWAQRYGLPFFTSAQFQASLDKVCDQMGVGTDAIRHNHRNNVLLEGSRKLGWHAAAAPQNTGGEEHYCGRCHLGCASAEKKGTVVSWLPAAAQAGAKLMEGLEVDEITFDETDGTKRATGVVGRWVSRDANGGLDGPREQRVVRDVVIKAKRVIVAGGTLCSPLLLRRSGLTNRHIGQNLRVHPCNMVGAYWKEPTTPWEGGIITSYCSSFENLDSSGHGVKLEPLCGVPYVSIANMPWRGGLESKLSSVKFRHFGGFIALTRDRDSGSVYPDEVTGRPRVAYSPSAFDRAHTLEGIIALAKICYIEGAVEIDAFLPGVEPFIREEADEKDERALDDGINNPRFAAWLDSVRRAGNAPPATTFSSAHQMGTCRMAANADEGVVDPKGRVFGVEGLYVADASVFPSATGTNPMVTVMAIADWIASGIADDLSGSSAQGANNTY